MKAKNQNGKVLGEAEADKSKVKVLKRRHPGTALGPRPAARCAWMAGEPHAPGAVLFFD